MLRCAAGAESYPCYAKGAPPGYSSPIHPAWDPQCSAIRQARVTVTGWHHAAGNLHPFVTEEVLQEVFAGCGGIAELKV